MLQNSRRKDQAGDKRTHTKSASLGGNGEPARSFSPQPQESSANPPITIGQIVCLICDAEKLTQMVGY